MVSATPDSWARICWVRRAMRTASSLGSESASSIELVCSDWQPPSTAARAWTATRTMLFCGLLGGEHAPRGLGVEAEGERARVRRRRSARA